MVSTMCFGAYDIDFSYDGLQALVTDKEYIHTYDVLSGVGLGEINSVSKSMHDHVHIFGGELRGRWECSSCKSELLENGEYWFIFSDRWLRIVEEHVARRLIHIPPQNEIDDIKGCQGYVAFGCTSGLQVLDTSRIWPFLCIHVLGMNVKCLLVICDCLSYSSHRALSFFHQLS